MKNIFYCTVMYGIAYYAQSGDAKCSTFAYAFEMHRRVKAAAQHSSSELGSAFALHFTCTIQSPLSS